MNYVTLPELPDHLHELPDPLELPNLLHKLPDPLHVC
jgi:hypothetical protein